MEIQDPESCVVRRLRAEDLEAVIRIDERASGRERRQYLEKKLAENLSGSGVEMSLGAEAEGALIGFLLARVYYGEFGSPEPVAVLDTLAVQGSFRGRGIGAALLAQLKTNLRGLGVETLQTEVGWDDLELMAFFNRQGFRPAHRLCLDLDLGPGARR